MAEIEASITRLRKSYNIYHKEQKALFLYLLRFKFLKAKPAAERAGINPRAAQGRVKRMKEDPEWDIYDKLTNKVNRARSQLQEEHKHFLINLFDEQPQATRQDAVDALTAAFEGFSLKETLVGTYIKNECNLTVKQITCRPAARNSPDTLPRRKDNCVFVDAFADDINVRPSTTRPAKDTPAIVTAPSTRAMSHTILGEISAMGVVNIEIRLPNLKPKRIRVDGSRKRKQPQPKKTASRGVVTSHYMLFLQNTMNFMDQFSKMKGFYIVMDNASIHTADDIDEMISNRGYIQEHLPPSVFA
ncbi:hypothetical protein PS15m_009115 [Mucor circinelloides]